MPVGGGDGDSLSFRMDDYPARIVVSPGAQPGMTAIGFEVLDERELERLVADVEKAGIKVTPGTEAEAADRRATGFVKFNDPGGNPVELFYGTVLDHVPVHTPLVSMFVTGDMGFGHAIVSAEDARTTFEFYVNVLGFIERNTMRSPGGTTWFMGCNPRHRPWGSCVHGRSSGTSPS
ncbi:VOC family protein [Streptomyces sp. NPDC002763]|uniref:VOC family protein n=1 Tax=Streptomyces sp. NPDC002763 TaxID=3154427 RepID=UPI0033215A59